MHITYINDTNRNVHVHPATREHGVQFNENVLEPMSLTYFHMPDNVNPFIKLWDHGEHLTLLVSYTSKG